MKRIYVIVILLFAIIFVIGIAHPLVFASDGGETIPTPTQNPDLTCTPTPTPTPSESPTCTPTPTVEVTPTIAGVPTITPIATPSVTLTHDPTPTSQPSNSGGPGDGRSDGRSDGLSSCPSCTQAPQGQVLGASTAVPGASTMAGTGTFEEKLMNLYAIFGMLLVAAGFTSYAKEKKFI